MSRLHRHKSAIDRSYVSDFTRFIDQFLEAHPEERREQHRGWRIYWDKCVDLKTLRELEESEVPTPSYYYFDSPPARSREIVRNKRKP